MKPGELVVVVY